MIELFENVTPEFKHRVHALVNLVINNYGVPKAVHTMREFSEHCSEDEKKFIDFYLSLRARQSLDESNYDLRQE